MKEFGLRITSPEEQKDILERQKKFTLPEADGAANILSGGFYGTYLDFDGRNLQNENDLIIKYREMAASVELDKAIQDIINEAIVFDEEGKCVDINLDSVEDKIINENTKNAIYDEFDKILKLLDFKNKSYDIFKNWYVDGRIYLHTVIDHQKPQLGVTAIDWVDPLKIKKIRVIDKQRDAKTGIEVVKSIKEHYVYNDMGMINAAQINGVRIAPDSIVYVPSGLLDAKRTQVLSYLHKAMKPYNQLSMTEMAMVIYRMARAPERRLFYIDVGTMSTQKANQYVRSLQQNFRNKLVYDAETGEIKDDRKFMSVLEDFWLPRREGGRGTEISTLPGGSNLGDIEDVNYLKNKLYQALNIPVSRMQPETGFSLGRSTEITRDEISFSKFIKKLRRQFAKIFDDILEKHLVLRGIVTTTEWKKIKQFIWYDFNEDNNFDELKAAELLRDRLDILTLVEPYVGKYFSRAWVKKNVLKFSEEDIADMDKEIEQEKTEHEDEGLPYGDVPSALDQMSAMTSAGMFDTVRKSRPATSAEGLSQGAAAKTKTGE
jgi:Bacteriophage T4-like portal protein (Gp20)